MPTKVEAWEDHGGNLYKTREDCVREEREASIKLMTDLTGPQMVDVICKNGPKSLQFRLALSVLAEWIAEVDRPPLEEQA